MNKQLLKDGLGWGFILWLIGYILGMVFFMIVPHNLIGWFIMPIGIIITLWVLIKKIKSNSMKYYFLIAIMWTIIAVVFDYLCIVKLLKSSSYYKLDVYIYYASTFLVPLIVGWRKSFAK